MLRSMSSLEGYTIQAQDGEIGKADDFCFDDFSWVIRYLVVDTGTWLPGRRVLLSPHAVTATDYASSTLAVSLTKQQVEESPPVSEDQPVSRQEEKRLVEHFDWPAYWDYPLPGVSMGAEPAAAIQESRAPRQETTVTKEQGDPHLRSVREVRGYSVAAKDGDIGHVEDFIIDEDDWVIRYIVVDTRNWLPSPKVLVSPTWFHEVRWDKSNVHVALDRATVKSCPRYDPNEPINQDYETQLYDYYGRPYYWA